MNKKYCPLQRSSADGYSMECSELCGWYIEKWEDSESVYHGRCAMQYMKDIFAEIQSSAERLNHITDSLQDINMSLIGGVDPCR